MMPAARAATVAPAFSAEADEGLEEGDVRLPEEEIEALPEGLEVAEAGAGAPGMLTLAMAVVQPVVQPSTAKKVLYV